MDKWWKECVFYQIYPRSFQDSNGDGIGDLRGIISRLDYLQWLGIGAVWLCPIYDSPNADMGYDIRDYGAIMAEFGTMEDFDELLSGLHQRGIRLIMDLVVNHTSDEHTWFTESRRSVDSPYRDYYIWRDGKDGREPNNWSSFFTPSAWSYDEATGQWYLHLFSEKQPDLNWENERLRDEIFSMINRWFDKGVDGFRMDVISLIAKNPDLPDAEGDGYVSAPQYFAFQPRLHEHLREMRERCFDGRDCMCVGETSYVTTENAGSVVGDGRELDMLFEFDIMGIDEGESKWDEVPFDLDRFKRIVSDWQSAVDWNTLFWGNHDQPRAVSRFGTVHSEWLRVRSAKMLAAAMYLQRGTPFIYQGEEIGMTNCPFENENELRDIESLNMLREAKEKGKEAEAWQSIRRKGRDNARTPMQWDDSENAGFTAGNPWIKVNPNYVDVNVRKAMEEPESILSFYRELIRLRANKDTLRYGDFKLLLPEHTDIFAYSRTYRTENIVVCCNFSQKAVTLPLEVTGSILLSDGVNGEEMEPCGLVVFEA